MKKLLILTGDIAAGKTTFSAMLAERYRINVLNKDPIKEILCDSVGFTDRAENLRLSAAATALMTYAFADIARLGSDCILEANFRTAELTRLHEVAREHGYEVLTLLFRGDIPLLHTRYLERVRCGRHPGHLSEPLDTLPAFSAYIEEARREQVCGRCIAVNADDFSYQHDEALLSVLDAFLS